MADKKLYVSYPYELNGVDMAVYGYLFMMNYNKYLPEKNYVSVSILAKHLNAPASLIKSSLQTIDENLIKPIEHGVYEIDLRVLYGQKNKFVKMPFNEIKKIVDSGERYRFRILEFFGWLLKSVDLHIEELGERAFMTHMPLNYFCKVLNANVLTVVKWEKLLEEMGIIYVFRSSDLKTPNYVGLVKYKDHINAYADAHKKYARKDSQDDSVSILQKYNALCRGVEYSDKEVLDIYNGVISYNKDHPNKARDLAVFKKYQITLDNVSA